MTSLLSELQSLEQELHHPGVRCSIERLEQILHPDFHDVGRSGRRYDRKTDIAFLSRGAAQATVVSDRFELIQPGETVALLTYRSARHQADRTFSDYALRSSVWVKKDMRWQLRYHQGTPASEPW